MGNMGWLNTVKVPTWELLVKTTLFSFGVSEQELASRSNTYLLLMLYDFRNSPTLGGGECQHYPFNLPNKS
jgi:hypothetical protein